MNTASTPTRSLSPKAIASMMILLLITLLAAPAHAAESRIEKTIKISEFNSVCAATGIEIVYTQGKFTGVANVSMSSSVEKYLRVEVEGGRLKAYYNYPGGKGFNNTGRTIVTVQSPNLKKIDLSSAAKFTMKGKYEQNRTLEVDLSSASSATFGQLICSKLDLDISSAAGFNADFVNGNVNIDTSSAAKASIDAVKGSNIYISVSSASGVSVSNVNGTNLNIEASSGAKVTADVKSCKGVLATASSGGSINLNGTCDRLSKNTSSGGSIRSNMQANSVSNSSSSSSSYSSSRSFDELEAQRQQIEAQRRQLEAQLEAQREKLEAQREALEKQREALEEQREALAKQREALAKQSGKVKSAKKASKNKKKTSTTSKTDESGRTSDGFRIP